MPSQKRHEEGDTRKHDKNRNKYILHENVNSPMGFKSVSFGGHRMRLISECSVDHGHDHVTF